MIIEKIKANHEQIKNLSDEEISQKLSHLTQSGKTFNICSNTHDSHEFLNKMESSFMDEEDIIYYNILLGRKPVSWDFNPSNRKRAEALLTVISTI